MLLRCLMDKKDPDNMDKKIKGRCSSGGPMNEIIISNVGIYAEIAEEAFAEMEKGVEEDRKPNSDGDGWIVTFDPSQKSFKCALVFITFSALWLEAILHLRIADKRGKSLSRQIDRKSYEEKLEFLGVNDQGLSDSLRDFRDLRREIIHEKAFFGQKKCRVAQDEAHEVRRMMKKVQEKLAEVDLCSKR
jgi:hypothetical protein